METAGSDADRARVALSRKRLHRGVVRCTHRPSSSTEGGVAHARLRGDRDREYWTAAVCTSSYSESGFAPAPAKRVSCAASVRALITCLCRCRSLQLRRAPNELPVSQVLGPRWPSWCGLRGVRPVGAYGYEGSDSREGHICRAQVARGRTILVSGIQPSSPVCAGGSRRTVDSGLCRCVHRQGRVSDEQRWS